MPNPETFSTKSYRALAQLRGKPTEMPRIAGQVVPVVLVDDLTGEALGSTPVNVTVAGGTFTVVSPGSNALATLGVPGRYIAPSAGALDTWANNTGDHNYDVTVPSGYAARLERALVTWGTAATPGSACKVALMLFPFSALPASGTSPVWNNGSQIMYSNAASMVATTEYYAQYQRGRNLSAPVGEVTQFRGLSSAVRTLWHEGNLPDMLILPNCGVRVVVSTNVAAGGDMNNVSVTMDFTLYAV